MLGVDADHEARLIVEGLEVALDVQLRGEGVAGRKAQEMPAVAMKAVIGFAPEIGGFVRDDLKAIALCRPCLRFVQPYTVTSAENDCKPRWRC